MPPISSKMIIEKIHRDKTASLLSTFDKLFISKATFTMQDRELEELSRRDPLATEYDQEQDGEVRDLLAELNDKKLFPGYEFSTRDKFTSRSITAIQQSILDDATLAAVKNGKDNDDDAATGNNRSNFNTIVHLEASTDPEEKQILENHTIYGSISTFKGREEMRAFKETLGIKKQMRELREKINEQENLVDFYRDKWKHFLDQSSQAKKALDKIEDEVSVLLKEHSYKPRIKDHNLNLPDDIKMLSQARFRLLIEHHGLHKGLFDEAESKIPILSNQLEKERQTLEETIATESALAPLIQDVKQKDLREFEELNIVSRHRYIAYEKKKKALYEKWESAEREEELAKEKKRKNQEEMQKYLDSKQARMKAFLEDSTEKMRIAESMKETPLKINERKAKALDVLAAHLKSIKADFEKKKRRREKQAAASVKTAKSVDQMKKNIMIKFRNSLKMNEISKKEADVKKMKIVEKILKQEYPDTRQNISLKSGKNLRLKPIDLEKVSVDAADLQSRDQDKLNIDTHPDQEGEDFPVKSSVTAGAAEDVSFMDMERDPSPLPPSKQRIPIPLVRSKPFRPAKNSREAISTKSPFEFDPPVVEFKDVISGGHYNRQIRVINATSSPKYFKFLSLTQSIQDYAVVKMDPSSNMCSGAQTFLSVEFTPTDEILHKIKSKEGNDDYLLFQSSCGKMMQLPFRFTIATCTPTIKSVGGPSILTTNFQQPSLFAGSHLKKKDSTPFAPLNAVLVTPNHLKLIFEECVMGDKRKMWIKIVNDGSISTAYYVDTMQAVQFTPSTSILVSGLKESTEELFSEGPFVVSQAAGTLDSYGSKTVAISFEPVYDVERSQTDFGDTKVVAFFHVKFEHQKEPFVIECHASTRALTLYPERQAVDFKTCLPGIYYQDKIQLFNRHKISRKFWVNTGSYQSVSHADTKITTIPGIATIEFCPSIGFIQPHSSCTVWLKIKFHREALAKLEGGEGKFCETIRFGYCEQATGSERFAPLVLRALITDSQVSVISDSGDDQLNLLSFGMLSIYERKQLAVKIINSSKFPQMVQHSADCGVFHLTPLPTDISESVFKIAPETTVRRTICFEPRKAESYSAKISFKTTWNQEIFIQCEGEGNAPPAHFNHSLISFQSIPFGNEDVKRVLLISGGKSSSEVNGNLSFEFKKPILLSLSSHESWSAESPTEQFRTPDENRMLKLTDRDVDMLHIWPKSGIISSTDKISVEILASLPSRPASGQIPDTRRLAKNDNDSISISNLMKPEKSTSKENGKDSKESKGRKERSGTVSARLKREETKMIKEGSNATGLEFQDSATVLEATPYQKALFNTLKPVASWLIPCVLKPVETEEQRLQKLLNAEAGVVFSDFQKDTSSMIYLKVIVPIIDSKFSLISPDNGSIDFPMLPVGKKASKKVTIQNISPDPLKLSVVGISPHGSFYLGKALRPIPPNEKAEIVIYFKPEFQGKFCDIAEFSAGLCKVPIRLVGEGVAPELQINQPDEVDFGNICVGDSENQEFEITNPSKVQVTIFFHMASTADPDLFSLNRTMKSPFSISAYRATLEPGESMKLILSFTPDREHDYFYDFLCIKHDGQPDSRLIKVKGKGWEVSPILLGYEQHPDSYLVSSLLKSPKEEYDWVATTLFDGSPLALGGDQAASKSKGKENTVVADYLVASSKRIGHFVTISLEWQKISGTELIALGYSGLNPSELYWRIVPKPIDIANLKPNVKGADAGKKSVEYSIEKIEGSFDYDPEIKDYTFTPPISSNSYNCGFSLSLQPSKGSLDAGATKRLELEIGDPARLLLHKAHKTWNRLDNVPLQPPQTRFKRDTDKSSLLTLNADWNHNQASEFKKMALEYEVAEPDHVEQVFKIVFKNGMRFVDPKGPMAPEESRIFYLKIVAPKPLNVD